MIAIEKLRAICQQTSEYAEIVNSFKPRPRAKDFFDIHLILTNTGADLTKADNLKLINQVFDAKKVPIRFLNNIKQDRDFHKGNYLALRDTLKLGVKLETFDYYFDYVEELCNKITSLLENRAANA